MGSPCELHLYPGPDCHVDEVARAAIEEVARLEHKYTRFRDDSSTARINQSAGDSEGLQVDDETASLLDYAQLAFEQSEGLFDITSGVLRRVWDFKSGRVPSQAEIADLLRLVGFEKLRWESPRLVLPLAGMEVDFGGYVKEYAADCAAQLCRERGVAHGMVDLGGDLSIIGPHPDGKPWKIGIRHPRRPESALASVSLTHGGVASSGDYERFMIVDGARYGHILNPRTGWPVTGLASVSVVATQCLVAGTSATIAMLKDPRDGKRWLDDLGLPNLRVTQEGEVSGAGPDWYRVTNGSTSTAGVQPASRLRSV